ncbi:Axial regulator YABBY 4 [Blyttiomyces sp. JEL0837]|nr:Axial regulator YABBY 4 [Blyttiomyces sp. JEL0837]
MPKVASEKSSTKAKGTRAPSAYNLFMKNELPRVKAANPTMSHKDAFKVAASNWKSSAENPVNQK